MEERERIRPVGDDGSRDIVSSASAEREIRRLRVALRLLSACHQRLVRTTDEAEMLQTLCDTLITEGGYRFAWIGSAASDPNQPPRPVAYSGFDDGYLAAMTAFRAGAASERDPAATALAEQRVVVCNDLLAEPGAGAWREQSRARGYRSCIALPLTAAAEVFGVLALYSAEPGVFGAEEVTLLTELAADIVFGITALRFRRSREEADNALRESEARLLEAQRLGRMGHWQLNLTTNVLTWSDEIFRIFEIDPTKFGASYEAFLEAVHPDDREAVNRAYTDSVKSRQPYAITHRLRMADGRIKYVHERGVTFYDVDLRPTRSLGTVQDITERVEAERAVETERQRLRGVLENLPVFLVLRTADRRFAFTNRFFRERFGDAGGRRCYEHLFGREDPCPNCESYTVLRTDALHEWQWLGPDSRDYRMFDLPFTDTDGSKLVLEVGIDVTDARRAEREIRELNATLEERVRHRTAELEAANRELEAFAYSVSHDLRAPLRSIDGFGRILVRDFAPALGDRGREHLQRVRAATQRMDQLIDHLLQLSRTARVPLRRVRVDLTTMARSIAAEFSRNEPARRVQWTLQPRVSATGDAVLLRTVLENLLGNAWKFTRQREAAAIEFGVTRTLGERVFFVRDNGAGFDMEHAGKLFRAFQRLHSAEEFPGSGIGLATVQRIVQRHGGRIWAESRANVGATFFFTLPGRQQAHETQDNPAGGG